MRIKTRLERIDDARLRRMDMDDIRLLEKRCANELRRVAADMRKHSDLATRPNLVTSTPGIGERTVLSVVVRMPELAGSVVRRRR